MERNKLTNFRNHKAYLCPHLISTQLLTRFWPSVTCISSTNQINTWLPLRYLSLEENFLIPNSKWWFPTTTVSTIDLISSFYMWVVHNDSSPWPTFTTLCQIRQLTCHHTLILNNFLFQKANSWNNVPTSVWTPISNIWILPQITSIIIQTYLLKRTQETHTSETDQP